MPPAWSSLAEAIEAALASGPMGLAQAALLLGRIESPHLSLAPALAALDDLSGRAATAVAAAESSIPARVAAINRLLFDTEGFRGDRHRYNDVRNSLLSAVLERKLGIPITLAVIYMTVARAAGIEILGVSFPGHFLMRVPRDAGDDRDMPLILDPFDRGRSLDRTAIQALLEQHAGDDATLEPDLLAPCTSRHVIVRMLNNLKRLYVGARSFPQAWQVTDLLVTIGGRQSEDVRDRGLIAYHLDHFSSALADLEAYLASDKGGGSDSGERRQVVAHVEALRRRVAGLN